MASESTGTRSFVCPRGEPRPYRTCSELYSTRTPPAQARSARAWALCHKPEAPASGKLALSLALRACGTPDRLRRKPEAPARGKWALSPALGGCVTPDRPRHKPEAPASGKLALSLALRACGTPDRVEDSI